MQFTAVFNSCELSIEPTENTKRSTTVEIQNCRKHNFNSDTRKLSLPHIYEAACWLCQWSLGHFFRFKLKEDWNTTRTSHQNLDLILERPPCTTWASPIFFCHKYKDLLFFFRFCHTGLSVNDFVEPKKQTRSSQWSSPLDMAVPDAKPYSSRTLI